MGDSRQWRSRQWRSGRMWTKFPGLLVLLAVGITGLTHAQVVHEERHGPPLSGEEWFRRPEADALRQVERKMGPADVTQDSPNLGPVSHWPFGRCFAVAVAEDYAYIGSGAAFIVLDVSDRSQPLQVNTLFLADVVMEIALSAPTPTWRSRLGGLRYCGLLQGVFGSLAPMGTRSGLWGSSRKYVGSLSGRVATCGSSIPWTGDRAGSRLL